MGNNYLDTVYNEQRTPKTSYPDKLAHYLAHRFNFKKGQTLLEIGCGRGDFLLAFKRLGLQCSGVDIEVNQDLVKELEVKQVDIEKQGLPFSDNSFDIIYHKSVIEHFYSPEKLMQETRRILKPGGKVVILTPDWVSQMKVFYEDITHRRPFDVTALTDCFKIYGFSNLQVEKFYQLPILWVAPILKIFAWPFRFFMPVAVARTLTKWTGIKFFRWSAELMILGYGEKS